MKRPVIIKRPGSPAAVDDFVSGGTLTPVQISTSTPAQVLTEPHAIESRRPRKDGAWGMPRPGEKIAKLGIDLTEEARRAFRAKAASEGRDVSDIVRDWIREYVEE